MWVILCNVSTEQNHQPSYTYIIHIYLTSSGKCTHTNLGQANWNCPWNLQDASNDLECECTYLVYSN